MNSSVNYLIMNFANSSMHECGVLALILLCLTFLICLLCRLKELIQSEERTKNFAKSEMFNKYQEKKILQQKAMWLICFQVFGLQRERYNTRASQHAYSNACVYFSF